MPKWQEIQLAVYPVVDPLKIPYISVERFVRTVVLYSMTKNLNTLIVQSLNVIVLICIIILVKCFVILCIVLYFHDYYVLREAA